MDKCLLRARANAVSAFQALKKTFPVSPAAGVLDLTTWRSKNMQTLAEKNLQEKPRSPKKNDEDNENNSKGVWWIRNPRTGEWMPENQIDTFDPAALRAKYIPGYATTLDSSAAS